MIIRHQGEKYTAEQRRGRWTLCIDPYSCKNVGRKDVKEVLGTFGTVSEMMEFLDRIACSHVV